MYAQNIEGGSWKGEKIDKGKIDKMSGITLLFQKSERLANVSPSRRAARAAIRTHAGHTKAFI